MIIKEPQITKGSRQADPLRPSLCHKGPEIVYSHRGKMLAIAGRLEIRAVTRFRVQKDIVPTLTVKRFETYDVTRFFHIVGCPVVKFRYSCDGAQAIVVRVSIY